MVQQTAPIWLQMKPDYIDENFENVVAYLSDSTTVKDNFFYLTLDLLEQRVQLALDDSLKTPLWEEDYTKELDQHKELHIKNVRLYLAFLLSISQEHRLRNSVICSLLYHLMCIDKSSAEALLIKLIEYCTYKNQKPISIYWDDVTNLQPSILIYRIVHSEQNSGRRLKDISYSLQGHIAIKSGTISISPSPQMYQKARMQQVASAISIANNLIRLYVESNLKISKTHISDIDKLEEWIEQITTLQMQYKEESRNLSYYKNGDEIEVVIVSMENHVIRVKTIDKEYEIIEGVLDTNWNSYKSIITYDYRSSDMCSAWKIGDIIAVRIEDTDRGRFSVFPALLECHNEDETVGVQTILGKKTKACALALWGIGDNMRVRWITEDGFIVNSFAKENIEEGQYWEVIANEISNGFVNATAIESTQEIFDIDVAKQSFLKNYVYDSVENKPQATDEIAPIDIKSLCAALMICQRQIHSVEERYKILCIARMLSIFIHKDIDAEYIAFLQGYLKNLTYFARASKPVQTQVIHDSLISLPSIKLRENILNILAQCGNTDTEIDTDEFEHDSLLYKLARLVQSYNNLKSVDSEKVLTFIRREIAHVLAIETEPDADLEDTQGINLGNESTICEYKTSVIYPPANQMQPAPEVQIKNICKGLCAFMNNSEGGKLYIGVNDGGNIQGIKSDMEYLKIKTVDAYIRYIQEQIKPYFKDAYTCLNFSAEYDNQVVLINIKPYNYGVVYFEEEAYYRWSASNRIMTKKQIEELCHARLHINNQHIDTILALQEAIRLKKKAILHNYLSSNSNTMRDRIVEPFALSNNNLHVFCYEIDSNTNQGTVKTFSISRIKNIQILEQPWQNETKHIQPKMDIFNMTGTEPIHIVLELDAMAYNLIIEEYPNSKKDVVKNIGSDSWTLDTNIYNINGAGRFCIGLWEHIKIHEGAALKTYVQTLAFKVYNNK